MSINQVSIIHMGFLSLKALPPKVGVGDAITIICVREMPDNTRNKIQTTTVHILKAAKSNDKRVMPN